MSNTVAKTKSPECDRKTLLSNDEPHERPMKVPNLSNRYVINVDIHFHRRPATVTAVTSISIPEFLDSRFRLLFPTQIFIP